MDTYGGVKAPHFVFCAAISIASKMCSFVGNLWKHLTNVFQQVISIFVFRANNFCVCFHAGSLYLYICIINIKCAF